MHYLQAFIAIGLLFQGEVQIQNEKVTPLTVQSGSMITTIRRYSSFFMDLAVLHYDCYKYEHEVLAMACIQCARKVKSIKPVWQKPLGALTGINEEDVADCFSWLWQLYEEFNSKKKANEEADD